MVYLFLLILCSSCSAEKRLRGGDKLCRNCARFINISNPAISIVESLTASFHILLLEVFVVDIFIINMC